MDKTSRHRFAVRYYDQTDKVGYRGTRPFIEFPLKETDQYHTVILWLITIALIYLPINIMAIVVIGGLLRKQTILVILCILKLVNGFVSLQNLLYIGW